MNIGFVGTRTGLSAVQLQCVKRLLRRPGVEQVVHGGCVGGDAQFHEEARRLGYAVTVHPPEQIRYRAPCAGVTKEEQEGSYIERTQRIAKDSSLLIVATEEGWERRRNGGTKMIIDFARKRKIPLVVLHANGDVWRSYEV